MKAKINKVTIQIVQDDLLSLAVGAIVNDTDTNLTLSPQMRAKAGAAVQHEVEQIGYCDVGSAMITSAGGLKAEHIIHAVGPRWGEGSERGKLANTVLECLLLAESNKLKSIAFPAISTGAMGYPLENCATTMLTQIIDFTFEDLKSLKLVVLCLKDAHAADVFRAELRDQVEALRQAGGAQV